jgi:BRCA1-associated protein
MIRNLKVSFGNPSLGTYSGLVSVVDSKGSTSSCFTGVSVEPSVSSPSKNDAVSPIVTSCLAAMVRVSPDQVPEGFLTLSRAHRQYFRHVRIVTILSDLSVEEGRIERTDSAGAELKESNHLFQDTDETSNLAAKLSMSYLVLFQLDSIEATQSFVQDLNGKPFTSLQPEEKCEVFHVVSARGDDGVSIMSPFLAGATHPDQHSTDTSSSLPLPPSSPSSAPELQNCAVCLEAMNPYTESILTTVCNHSFHFDCLVRWQDSPCPVCRYDHSSLNETLSQCHICGTTFNNYVCLICGVVSCGGGHHMGSLTCSVSGDDEDVTILPTPNRPIGHARLHFEQTLHAYALETRTQHVWDFAGDGYVHRLIRNSDDGKLVEVNDPGNTTSNERTLSPGLSDTQEEEFMHRKLESFANQYYTLLKSQLEQQRNYYEARLMEMRREHDQACKKLSAADLILAMKQERHQLEQRCLTLERKNKKALEEVAFLKSMSESLAQNKYLMDQQIQAAQKERANAQEMIQKLLPPLESKVALLMQQLDGVIIGSEGQGQCNDRFKTTFRKVKSNK